MTVLLGSDYSAWQAGLYAGSDAYVGMKASEGVGFQDPAFLRHMAAARARGAILGPYHFGRPDLGNSPEAEADWFARVVEAAGGPAGMWPSLDLEVSGGPLAGWRDRFCDRLEARWAYTPWWYDYWNHIYTHALNTATPYKLWLAWPDANGAFPSGLNCGPVRMQQYGLKSVPGIVGQVDANRFFGDLAQLKALTVGGPAAASPAGGSPMAVGQCLYLNGINHLFLLGGDGVVRWSSTAGGAGGFDNPQQSYVAIPCFSTDIRDIWVSQDHGPARPDGSGDAIDRILLFAAFGDGSLSFCVLNPTDVSTKVQDWQEPLPSQHLRARVPLYQGQAIASGPIDEGAVVREAVNATIDEAIRRLEKK